MNWRSMQVRRALRPGGKSTGLIKGEVSSEPLPGLVPGFSASGQDVWVPKAIYSGPGLVLSAVGARCGKVFEASGNWGVVANTAVLIPQSGCDPHYLWYMINNEDFWEKGGTAQPYVRVSETLSKRMKFPDLDGQRAIADYLDTETARIDALIEKKRRMVELLEDRSTQFRRQSLLGEMNPISGHGSLPDGWRVANLGIAFALQRGHDLPTDVRRNGEIPVVSSGGISGRHDIAACQPPGVVTGRYGTIGSVFYLDCAYWPLNTTLFVKEFRGNEPRWVYRMLQALPLDFDAEKSAVTGINRNVIGGLRVPIPPVKEQRRIADEVDEVDSHVANTSERLSKQIDLLIERRQALVTAAVTGELTIRGVAA